MRQWIRILVWLGCNAQSQALGLQSYDEFKRLFEKNPKTGKVVQSFDELLPALSDELRSNFTFVYESRSPHGGMGDPEKKAVDTLFPRTVLFTKDGRLALAFTGNPNKPGYGEVEAIRFEDEGSRWVLSQFVLGKGESQANPAQCLRCHGADPRPITDSYPLWPGFYGSVRDAFPKGTPELAFYRRFLKQQSNKGVYRHLKFPKGSSVSPYLDPKDYNAETVQAGTDELKFLPNTRLGMAWTELNRKRLQRKLQASPLYEKYRLPLLSGLLGCEKLPIAREVDEQVYSDIHYENEDRLVRIGYRPMGPGKAELDMPELQMYENLSQILYMARVLDVNPVDWSLAFESRSLSFFDGILSGMQGAQNFYLKEDFILELLRDIASEDARFKPYFKTYGSYAQSGYPFGTRLDLGAALGACALLKRQPKSKSPLPVFAAKTEQHHVLPSANVFLQKIGASKSPFRRCTVCHEGEGSLTSGRKIPFSDPSALFATLQSKSQSGKPFAVEIEERIVMEGEGQMPPRGDRLTREEKSQFTAYVREVAEFRE